VKKETLQKRVQIANDVMYYIYTHIDTDINMDELSSDLEVSKFHMHHIFKEVFGRNIYESIKSIRLQKASNLLLTNRYSTITNVANLCGYSSQTSFIRAFRARFGMTPKQWRNGGYKEYSDEILKTAQIEPADDGRYEHIEPAIVKMPAFSSYYIRHRGYDATIKQTWQKLQVWILNNDLIDYKQIALFHDNPTITPLDECQYVACVVTQERQTVSSYRLPSFKISEGVYAKFDLSGKNGDLLNFINWVYHGWLPKSGFETTTKPPYAIYKKNNYLSKDGSFEVSFYLSIRF